MYEHSTSNMRVVQIMCSTSKGLGLTILPLKCMVVWNRSSRVWRQDHDVDWVNETS